MKTDDVNRLIDQRQALAHKALDEMVAENQRLGLYDDAVNMSQERVDLLPFHRHVSYVCPNCYWSLDKQVESKWVGLTDDEIYDYADKFLYQHGSNYGIKSFGKAIEAKLKEKNSG